MSDSRRLFITLAVIATASALAWLGWGFFAWIAVMAAGMAVLFYLGFHRPNPELAADSPAESVNVGSVPNVPFAEMVVTELQQSGIEAFYKVGSAPYPAASSVTTPSSPCDIYVERRDAEAAQSLLRLGTSEGSRTTRIGRLGSCALLGRRRVACGSVHKCSPSYGTTLKRTRVRPFARFANQAEASCRCRFGRSR